jgi:hypothetical protein
MVSTVTDPIEAALAEMEAGICNCPAPRQGGWCGAGGSLDKPRLIAALRVAWTILDERMEIWHENTCGLTTDGVPCRRCHPEYLKDTSAILRALRGEGE